MELRPRKPISKQKTTPPKNSKLPSTGKEEIEDKPQVNTEEETEEFICPFNYLNFETEDHWKTVIPFLGTPLFQFTSIWENYNKIMKNQGITTNQKNVSKDVLTSMLRKESYERARKFKEDSLFESVEEEEDYNVESCNFQLSGPFVKGLG